MVRTMKLFFLVIGCIPLLGGGGCCGLAMAVVPEEEDERLFRKGINTEGGTNPRTTVASYHERSQEEMMMFEGRVELEAFGVGTSFKAITTPLIDPTQIAKAIDPMNSKSPFITETSNEDTSKEKTPLGVAAVPPTLAKVGMGKFKDEGQPLSYHTVGTNFLISTLLVSAVYWYLEFDKLPRAFPQVFSWSDPSFWAVYLRAVFLQIAFIQIRNPDHVALLSKLVHQKSGPLKQLFRLHNYTTDILVNQDTNPIEQSLRAAATRFSSNRVRERFCVAYQIFQELVQMTAQRGQPLNTSMASALFKHSNKILFDYIPSTFTSMDMTELIDFLNFDNLDGIGLLQTFCPWTYKLPLRRNKRRNAIIEKFGPLWESILKQQKTLINQGRDCLLLAALENIHDKDSRKKIEEDDDCLKSFFMGLYIASFLTSITTSCVVLHHLAKNHHAQELIAQEIKDTFPEDMKDLTHSHLMRLVHTRSFVMEVMRYFSPAPSLGRRVGRINLNLSLKALNESSSLWDKPKRLVPNRFVNKSRLDRRSHKFFPFGVGRRSCPGQEYVQFEFVLIVALFVREYKIRHEDLDTQLHLSYLGSIPTIMNPSDLVFDFFPRHINTNRRAALMRRKSTASFMMPGTTQRTFSGVAKLNSIFMGT